MLKNISLSATDQMEHDLPWKLAKRFRFDKMLSSNPVISDGDVEQKPMKISTEFFNHSNFGSFLTDYAGLWLLPADIAPNMGQKSTKLTFVVPDDCIFVPNRTIVPPLKCHTFNFESVIRQLGRLKRRINPLVYEGNKTDIKHLPWTVYFEGIKPFNATVNEYCGIPGGDYPDDLRGRKARLIPCPEEKLQFINICLEEASVEQGDSGGALLASNGTHFVQIGVTSIAKCLPIVSISVYNMYSRLDGCWIEEIAGIKCAK
ncbi:hypothetical protein niasHT_031815 [Heterodera trifolii]|uniref:Peptidase S1 domain-containing protein n=1 Tax=Heterodera trifolii TaxID=157864 RepID=A0ABD2IK32_9BILA